MAVIFIDGAGYVGNALAITLRKLGHTVYVLIRSAEKEKKLHAHEVRTVLGDLTKLETYEKVALEADYLIHTSHNFTLPNFEQIVLDNFSAIAKKSNAAGNPKKVFIYTSGGLVYKTTTEIITEDSELNTTSPIFQGFLSTRISAEKQAVESTDWHGVVLRLPLIYGGEDGHYTTYFKQGEDGKVVVFGDGQNRLSYAHVDDVVGSYIAVINSEPSKYTGQFFNVSEPETPSTLEVATAFARAAGFKGTVETGADWGPHAHFNGSLKYDVSKIKKAIGWSAARQGIVAEAPNVYLSYKVVNPPVKF